MNEQTSLLVLRWLARITSLASIGLLGLFAFGGGEASPLSATPSQMLLLLFFPLGVVAGMVFAWWKELAGGLISFASLAAFYAVCLIVSQRLPGGPYFAIFTSPAALFLLSGTLHRMAERHADAQPRA